MRLVRDLDAQNLCPHGSVVTIGNFDGLHRGHAALIERARSKAKADKLLLAVITFDPMAREHFAPSASPARIYNASERLRLLSAMGIDLIWLLRFNTELAETDATDFVRSLLVRGLHARHIVVGHDFRFGKGRAGDIHLLKTLGASHGFEVSEAPVIVEQQERISSTGVRKALWRGQFTQAQALLGRPYRMFGRVVRGNRLGHQLGMPTANIRLHRVQSPLHGIFAVTVDGDGLQQHAAVASVGCRPTIDGTEMLLEVHLFDFDGDLYGQHLEVQFVKKLREEERFENLDALTTQMHLDAQQARALLAA
jgi:riboflavin kinase/FMN adenylyltransferase